MIITFHHHHLSTRRREKRRQKNNRRNQTQLANHNLSALDNKQVKSYKVSKEELQYEKNVEKEDEKLDELGALMSTLHDKGLALNNELKEQANIIDHLDYQIDQTAVGLSNTSNKMDRIT